MFSFYNGFWLISLFPFGFQEYNRDQARAISCGLAMIQRKEKTPKFLLIHGPPGTGKSKTIGGLLYKLLSSVFVFMPRYCACSQGHLYHTATFKIQFCWLCFVYVCGDLFRVITVLLLWGTFNPRLEGHAFFSVHPLTLPLTVWWRKSLWSSKKNAKTSTLLKVSELAHALTVEKYISIYCHIKARDTTLLCTGNCGDINLVRLGSERTISKSLKPFSLDQQTKARAREKQIHALTPPLYA